jgi:hypothetical protein
MKTFLTFLFLFLNLINYECHTNIVKLNNSYGHGNLKLYETGNLSQNANLTLTLVTGSLDNSKRVAEYYSSFGSLTITSQTNLHVKVKANISEISKVFNISFASYKCPFNVTTKEERTCFASTSMVSIPASLDSAILGIVGLERVLNLKPNFVIGQNSTLGSRSNLLASNVAKIYGFPDSTGAGVQVGIISLGGYFNQSDLQIYFTQFGLGKAPKINMAFIDDAHMDYTDYQSSLENYLNVEIIATVVPQANITIYFGENSFDGLYNAIYAALQQSDVISISWGTFEIYASSYLSSFQAMFALYSLVPILVATGEQLLFMGVGFPASCPNVIGSLKKKF